MKNRILIIDDDEDLVEELAESFSCNSFIVGHRNDGRSGIRELAAQPNDFLILDIKIPGLNGFKILEILKR